MRRFLILAVVVAISVAACSSSAKKTAPTATTTTVARYTPKLVSRPCNYDPPLRVKVDCSYLVVPENRAEPGGRQIKLAVAYLHSTSATPLPDPVVYLHGGPGGDEVAGARNGWDTDSRLAKRDIVLYDQRGAGLSQPSLNCPEVDAAIVRRFTRIDPYATELADRRAAYAKCRVRLEAQSVDLDEYNSEASASDLSDLRSALKIDEWNLLGVSYGTRLALAEMRSHPEGVRTVLLDSAYPPPVGGARRATESGQRAIDQLVAGCAADAACAKKYGDLDALLQKAYDQLNAHPYEGDVDLGAANGGTTHLAVNGYDALGGIFTALYDHTLIPVLPSVISAVAKGDYSFIPAVAQQGIPFATQFADGDALSVDCVDSGAVDRDGTASIVQDPGKWAVLVSEQSATYCDTWGVTATPSFNEPVHSDIPALVLAGKYDPVTPPANSEATARNLAHATFAEIDGIGHGVIFSNPCGSAIYRSFLDNPAAPDTSCAPKQPPPKFA